MPHPAIPLVLRPVRRRSIVLALATMACALLPTTAGAATLHATTSTFASTVAAAQPGDSVLLASGSYGAWKGVTKTSPGITIRPESGATPSMSLAWDTTGSPAWLTLDGLTITGGQVSGPTHDVTVKNSTFPGYLQINPGASPGANNACGNCPAMNDNHIVFDNDVFNLASCPSGSCLGYEGRISFAYQGPNPAGVTVKNSTFTSGCADGVQFVGSAGRGVTIGPGNTFTNLLQGSCGPHVDSIQFVGGNGATITGNYFSNITTGIASYDGGTTGIVVSDNVFASSEVGYPILLGGDSGAVIEHNTLAAGKHINLTSKAGASSRNEIIRNNIAPDGVVLSNGVGGNATPAVNDYNLCSSSCSGSNSMSGTASYVGPSSTYAGWALKSGSPGRANASDGSDRGIRVSGSTPPPPADTTAPDTTISSGPTGTTNDTTPTFAFTSSESNSVFECRVDSGSWADCTSPWTTPALGDGAHSVSVRATDVAGNTDASPATRSFTVDTAPPPDTTAPDTTISSGPTGTTNDTTPTFAFTSSESNSVFECRVDSGSWADCTSPWTTAALGDGAHSVSVRATDVAGNTDASPATRSFTVDTAPPPDTTAPDTTISSGPTGTTSDTTPTFAFTATEPGSFECRVDSAAWATCTSPWTTAALSDGPHSVSVRATDAAGNTDATPATRSITVDTAAAPDTTAPDTNITSGPTGTTTTNAPTFAFTATEAGSTFECRVDSAAWATCTSPWTTAALSDGPHSVSVRATDAAGNTDAAPATRSFTVGTAPPPDTTAPDTTIGSGPNSATKDATPTFAFSATETGSTFRCRVDAGAWASCASPWTTAVLSDGPHSVSVRATDGAGNADASPATRSFSVDTQAPNTTISSAPPAISPGSSASLAFSASESGASFECQLDGGAWTACTSPKTYTGLALGQHTVAVRATDAAGNVDPSVASASWTTVTLPDLPAGAPTASGGSRSANQAPTVTLRAPAAGSTFTSTLTMTATARDDHGVRDVEFWVDGVRVARDTAAPYGATFVARKTTSYGVHTVSVRAVDAAGRARSAAVTVTRVRLAAAPKRKPGRANTGRARAASASDDRQSTLVSVSLWRVSSAPVDGGGTLLRGRGIAGHSATVSLASCDDGSGAVAAVMEMRAGADGTLYARQPAEGLCVLRVQPLGDA